MITNLVHLITTLLVIITEFEILTGRINLTPCLDTLVEVGYSLLEGFVFREGVPMSSVVVNDFVGQGLNSNLQYNNKG